MYLFETLPARWMALKLEYKTAMATTKAIEMSFSESSKYLPEAEKVTWIRVMISTGNAIRKTAYGIICTDSSCLTSVESVCRVFRTMELSMATLYLEMKYVAAALAATSKMASGLIVQRCASSTKNTKNRHRPARR